MIAAGIAAVALLGFFALVYLRQEAMIFFPEKLPPDYPLARPDVEQVWIRVDGAKLSALHLKLAQPKGVVFFLHGNAGSLGSWFVDTDLFSSENFDLFMIDYRGYGKSTGRIESEAQLHADVAVAWDSIAGRYRDLRKVLVGRSLGSALAARLAARIQPDLTILVSPYWSVAEVARLHYPLLPGFLLRYPLMTFQDIGRIEGPVLLIHGDLDPLIPLDHSVRLQAAARNAQLVRIAGGAHNDLQDFDLYRHAIAAALARL
ncbi:MAG TPA: alpha/beta fold hydrolase [Burkholderiaceae bacterium]|nr:alpha/beta fold hydrolase [Burkholderiaceae bacterium]